MTQPAQFPSQVLFRRSPPSSASSDDYNRASLQYCIQRRQPVAAQVQEDCCIDWTFACDFTELLLTEFTRHRWTTKWKRVRNNLRNYQSYVRTQASRKGTRHFQRCNSGVHRGKNNCDFKPVLALPSTRKFWQPGCWARWHFTREGPVFLLHCRSLFNSTVGERA
jgi:hypothetical protein